MKQKLIDNKGGLTYKSVHSLSVWNKNLEETADKNINCQLGATVCNLLNSFYLFPVSLIISSMKKIAWALEVDWLSALERTAMQVKDTTPREVEGIGNGVGYINFSNAG